MFTTKKRVSQNQQKMKILFLDLSTKSTGWAVGEDGELINYGCVASSSQNVFKRINIVQTEINKVIEQYEISKIIIEEVRPDIPNSHTFKLLTWLQGLVLYCAYLYNNKIDYEFIQANSWRSKIGIHTGPGVKRETLKKADIDYVKNKYGISANDDVCDAICLMDAYYIKEPTKKSESFDWN